MTGLNREAFITVNGQSEPLASGALTALLERMEIGETTRGVAVAINGAVVPRAAWAQTRLDAGDRIEIVRARQGG
jgi:sulfur carrier protein